MNKIASLSFGCLLIGALSLRAAAVPKPDMPSIMGSGNFTTGDKGATLSGKIGALQSVGAKVCRVALVPGDYYPGGKAGVSASTKSLVDALVAQGITPYIHFEYYQNEYSWGPGPILSYDWTGIGTVFATEFGARVPYYAAVNEPDMASVTGGSNAVIPPADYATALGNLASGVHAVDPSIRVIPGGLGRAASFHDWKCGGYPHAIAALLASGALDGIDLHIYWGGDNYTPIKEWGISSEEGQFEYVKSACGLGDVKLYCTEFNQSLVSGTGPYAIDETEAARRLLTLAWSVLCTTKNDHATPNTQIALPWTFVESQASFGLFTTLSPWTPNARGATMQSLLSLTAGMQFSVINTPAPHGGCIMTGPDKKLWVIHNVTNSVWTVSPNFTCTEIPSNATRLLRYGYDGLRETVHLLVGTTTYKFADIPAGETTMIQALP